VNHVKRIRLFAFVSLWGLFVFCVPCAAAVRSIDVNARPLISLLKVSPDGRQLCVVASNGDADAITLIDLATFKPETVADLNDTRLLNYWWKGQNFLVLLVADEGTGYLSFRSLELSTKKVRPIVKLNHRASIIKHPLLHDEDHLLLSTYQGSGVDLKRLNVRTGKTEVIEKNPGYVKTWLVRNDGTALAAVGAEEQPDGDRLLRKSFLLRRNQTTKAWERVYLGRVDEPRLLPLSVHPDQRRIIAWDFRPETTASVVAIDPATMETEVLFNSPKVNPSYLATWGDNEHDPKAIVYETDIPRRVFLQEDARQLQAAIDSALPGTINDIVSHSLDLQVMVVHAQSDRNPGSYYLLDRRGRRLMPLGALYAGFPPGEMATGEHFEFLARDGLPLTGRILWPVGVTGRPPLIVMTPLWVNGERTTYYFDRLHQFLASAGYAVAQIDWRGTVGFGRKFSEAGDFQIESGLPNDLEDGVRWLIAQGRVDSRHVVLFSASSGGLPAVHALARPGLFTAWVNSNTLLESWRFSYEALAPSRLDEREVIEARGSSKAVEAYKKSLNVVPLLAQIRLPQFHHYVTASDSELSLVRKAALKSGAPAVFHHYSGKSEDLSAEVRQAELLDEILAFLKKYAPPSQP
jgi:dipeptidyl aminopeptidase/acylaminoacyl peptidase